MMRFARTLLAVAGALFTHAPCRADTPAAPTSQRNEAVSTQVERILDRSEAAGDRINGLKAKMAYERNQKLVKEITERDGAIQYLKKTDPAAPAGQKEQIFFLVRFDNLKTKLYVSTKMETYSLHDRFLDELNEKTSMLIHREVVPPGQVINPTRLGEGPFPVPFGQKKKDVLENFTVQLVAPADKDPRNSDHLELIPKPGNALAKKYKKVSFFISRENDLPVRIVTESSEDIVTAEFTDIQINPKQTPDDFILKRPPGFQENTIPLNKP